MRRYSVKIPKGKPSISSKVKRSRSKIINAMRTNKLVIRNKALIKLLNKTQIELRKKCKQDTKYYSQILRKLIFEGLVKMMEPEVIIYPLQRDKALVQEIVEECKRDYEEITLKELGEKKDIIIRIADSNYLIERNLIDLTEVDVDDITDDHEHAIRLTNQEDDKICFGGVVLKDKTERIICKNTLDLRTEMAFQQLLPEIRQIMFTH